MNISLAVVVAYAGVGLLGCVVPVEGNENNANETETETGDGDGDGDNTEVGDGDGDNTEVGDGDGDTAETGETGTEDGVCGDGVVDEDEECDDGNTVDDDECSNSCVAAVCGDGVVQEAAGEECDDGNTDSGDGCLADCMFPGGMIAEEVIDFGDSTNDIAEKVVLGSDDNIGVVLVSDAAFRLAQYDPTIEQVYNVASLVSDWPSLAIGPDDLVVVGGKIGNNGATRQYAVDSSTNWTTQISTNNSSILDVAIDSDGFVVAAGFAGNNDPLLVRYNDAGVLDWEIIDEVGDAFGPVTVGLDGQIYVARETPRHVESYASDGTAGWVSEDLGAGLSRDIVADDDGNVYLLTAAEAGSMFMLTRFDNTGASVWTVTYAVPDVDVSGSGLTLLPSGAILVAGSTNGDTDGLLNWYDIDGELLHTVVVPGAADGFSGFVDVAVAPSGHHAVAFGSQSPTSSDSDLWFYKFEI